MSGGRYVHRRVPALFSDSPREAGHPSAKKLLRAPVAVWPIAAPADSAAATSARLESRARVESPARLESPADAGQPVRPADAAGAPGRAGRPCGASRQTSRRWRRTRRRSSAARSGTRGRGADRRSAPRRPAPRARSSWRSSVSRSTSARGSAISTSHWPAPPSESAPSSIAWAGLRPRSARRRSRTRETNRSSSRLRRCARLEQRSSPRALGPPARGSPGCSSPRGPPGAATRDAPTAAAGARSGPRARPPRSASRPDPRRAPTPASGRPGLVFGAADRVDTWGCRSRTRPAPPPISSRRPGGPATFGRAPRGRGRAAMSLGERLHALDRLQQRHRRLALPAAVIKKFGDDEAGRMAALIAYYGFVSLFPLLLVLVTVLGFVLEGDQKTQERSAALHPQSVPDHRRSAAEQRPFAERQRGCAGDRRRRAAAGRPGDRRRHPERVPAGLAHSPQAPSQLPDLAAARHRPARRARRCC